MKTVVILDGMFRAATEETNTAPIWRGFDKVVTDYHNGKIDFAGGEDISRPNTLQKAMESREPELKNLKFQIHWFDDPEVI